MWDALIHGVCALVFCHADLTPAGGVMERRPRSRRRELQELL